MVDITTIRPSRRNDDVDEYGKAEEK